MGFSRFSGTGGTTGESGRSGIVCVDNVYCVSLVVFLNAYKGVVSEDSGFGSKLQIKLVGNCADEVIYRLVDFVGRGVRRARAREGVELVKLERRLLSVASPSVKLAGAGNFGNIGVGKVVLVV